MIKEIIKAISNLMPIAAKTKSGFNNNNLNCIRISKKLEDIELKAIFTYTKIKSQLYKKKLNQKLIMETF